MTTARRLIKPNAVKRTSASGHAPDYALLIVVAFLSVWGAIMVYSGSVIVAVKEGNTPYFYFEKQVIAIILGAILAYIAYRIDYRLYPKLIIPALMVMFMSLIIVLFVHRADNIRRWIDLGFFQFQPSELTKLVFVIYLASWLSKQKLRVKATAEGIKWHLTHELLPFMLMLFAVTFLILIQPDFDTAALIGIVAFIMYFMAGNDWVHLLASALSAIVVAVAAVIASGFAKYRLTRITTYLDFWRTNNIPDPLGSGYQFRQILVAVASGGLFGVGFGESRQKFHYLGNTAFTDTIFAIFAEEFGLVGSVILVGLFIYLMLKGYRIARSAPDRFGFLLGVGITSWITLQALQHIAANVGLIPINGNTLPFFSYGGSSTVINLIAIGILLNISKYAIHHRQE